MATQEIAAALQRVESVLRRRPGTARSEDASATARWQGELRVTTRHPKGIEVVTDMPTEFGGTGDKVSPGWLLRAGAASCITTRIAMSAAAEGIELSELEVVASSRSDARGLLGMSRSDGDPISAAPYDVQLHVRIAAAGVAPDRLRTLVEDAHRVSPVSAALQELVPVTLHVDARAA
jgi:uncharacterized OsmC-like protein